MVDPDTDEFANLDNWSVIPVKNYHQHKHENCYVEGIKHYNTQNGKFFVYSACILLLSQTIFEKERYITSILAKRCRAERGQVIAVCDGVVKDLTNLPPQEQQRALQMANATDNDSRPISVNEMRANQKQKEYQLALLEDATLIRQTDTAQATITLEQRYDLSDSCTD